jgi:hypothetical protein
MMENKSRMEENKQDQSGSIDTKKERKKLKINIKFVVSFTFVAVFAVFSFIFYWESYLRLFQSFKYFWESLKVFFNFDLGGSSEASNVLPPNISEEITEIALPSDITEAIYQFKVWTIALFNRDILLGYLVQVITFVLNVLKYVVWLPDIIIVGMLLKQLTLSPRPDNVKGDSKLLKKYKSFETIIVSKVKYWIASAYDYWLHYKIFGALMVIILLLMYRVIPVGLDIISWFIILQRTMSFSGFPALLGSITFDIFIILYKYDNVLLIFVAAYLFLKARKQRARAYLHRMQAYNEQVAANLPIATLVTGPIGSGKTMLVTSLAIDIEMQMRMKSLAIIKKYARMFPEFPWDNFEGYIRFRTSTIVSRSDTEEKRLVNRAQIIDELGIIFDGFIEQVQDGKSPSLFGYDYTTYPLQYFDGIKNVSVLDALEA